MFSSLWSFFVIIIIIFAVYNLLLNLYSETFMSDVFFHL